MVYQELPNNYKESNIVDLKANKQMLIVNLLAVAIMLVMIFCMNYFIPINSIVSKHSSMNSVLLKVVVIAIGFVLYVILHEAVHGLTMKCFGAKRLKFGFRAMYAYAGSDEYFSKGVYIMIALSPVLVWGIVLGIVNAIVSYDWFWVIFALQIANISSSSGDLYIAFKFTALKKADIVKDTGTVMTVYSKNEK